MSDSKPQALLRLLAPRTVWSTAVFCSDSLTVPPTGTPDLVLDTRRWWRSPGHIHTKADPFLFEEDGRLYLFHESQRLDEPGFIEAHVLDGGQWSSLGCILSEPTHLSYPHVLRIGGSIYLLPESQESRGMRLYRFERFPFAPVLHRVLLEGQFADPSPMFHQGLWYVFATSAEGLELFVTDDLVLGALRRHPASPITRDPRFERCGGVPIMIDGRWVRPAQDCSVTYGGNLNLMAIEAIGPQVYDERLLTEGLFTGDQSWNRQGGHHLSICRRANGKVAVAVDGQRSDYPHHKFLTRGWMELSRYRRGSRPPEVRTCP